MSARKNDLLRVQEMYDVVTQTLVQLEELNITKDQFVSPRTTTDELIAEGFANRVLRVTEEGGGLPGRDSQNRRTGHRGDCAYRNSSFFLWPGFPESFL